MANRGAPKGNKNRQTHGLLSLQSAVARRARRGRDRIDRRSSEGREAIEFRSRMIEDKGGLDNLSTGEFMGIVGLSETWWLRAMQFSAIKKYLHKNPHLTGNPKAIAALYSYVSPVDDKIIRLLQLLGLEKKAPPAKTLEEILSEDDSGSPDDNGVVK